MRWTMVRFGLRPSGRALSWVFFGGLLAALAFTSPLTAQPIPRPLIKDAIYGKPNLVVIMADGIGYGDLGCYGQTLVKTPNLDRLASQGLRFTQAYAGGAEPAPSTAALLTGRHTGHGPVRGENRATLAADEVTAAKLLKQAGYITAFIGKWGLGGNDSPGAPNRQGFDQWFGFLDNARAREAFPATLWRNQIEWRPPGNANGARQDYALDWFTKAATNYLRTSKDFPFFLCLAYPTPRGEKPGAGPETPGASPYADKDWPEIAKQEAAFLNRLDQYVGSLIEALAALKIANKTIVFFASDTGPPPGDGKKPDTLRRTGGLRGGRGSLFEGGLRVPLIAYWPGRIKPGTVTSQPAAFWDLLPTFAELAGAPAPSRLDGLSLVPTLLGARQTNQHEYLYWESHAHGPQQAVRWADWKAVRSAPGQPLELYHLGRDLAETNNLAKTHPMETARAEEFLEKARTDSVHWPWKPIPSQEAGPSKP